MKNAKWMLTVTVLLMSGLMAAQSLTSSTVVANVPFDFMVNNKIIPAGECVVKSADGNVLTISNFDARKAVLAASSHGNAAKDDRTVMVFERLSLTTRPTRVRVFVSDFVEVVAT